MAEFKDIGFKSMLVEPCILKMTYEDCIIIIAIYVDDVRIFTNNKSKALIVIKKTKFQYKSVKMDKFLNNEIIDNANSRCLANTKLINQLIEEYEITKEYTTPICINLIKIYII